MKTNRLFVGLLLAFFILFIGGYFAKNIFQWSLKDQIFVGQMAMEDSERVVGRDITFQKSNSPTLDAQLLFSIWNRFNKTSTASQRLVVTDLKGNILLDRPFTNDRHSTVLNLHPIQEKAGKYLLTWFVNDRAIANRQITVE